MKQTKGIDPSDVGKSDDIRDVGDDHSRTADGYQVGPGHPPREHQFKPGRSGNPLGAKLRKRSMAPDLRAMLLQMLHQKVRVSEGEKLLTKAAAGIGHLVNGFAAGDRNARRDLMQIAGQLNVDLTAGQSDSLSQSLAAALTQNDLALIDGFVQHYLAEREAERQQEQEDLKDSGGSGIKSQE